MVAFSQGAEPQMGSRIYKKKHGLTFRRAYSKIIARRCCIKGGWFLPKGGMRMGKERWIKVLRFLVWLVILTYILTTNAR